VVVFEATIATRFGFSGLRTSIAALMFLQSNPHSASNQYLECQKDVNPQRQ
jgi:hypothetical protein